MELSEAHALALALMTEYGISDWTFSFDRATSRGGQTNHRLKRITLSRTITEMNPVSQVRNTILHEIAHAMVGGRHGHDAVWRAQARQIGCNGQRTHSMETPTPKYTGTCPSCGHTRQVSRRARTACGWCCRAYNRGYFDARFVFEYSLTPAP